MSPGLIIWWSSVRARPTPQNLVGRLSFARRRVFFENSLRDFDNYSRGFCAQTQVSLVGRCVNLILVLTRSLGNSDRNKPDDGQRPHGQPSGC